MIKILGFSDVLLTPTKFVIELLSLYLSSYWLPCNITLVISNCIGIHLFLSPLLACIHIDPLPESSYFLSMLHTCPLA